MRHIIDLRNEEKFRTSLFSRIKQTIENGVQEINYIDWESQHKNSFFDLIIKNAQ